MLVRHPSLADGDDILLRKPWVLMPQRREHRADGGVDNVVVRAASMVDMRLPPERTLRSSPSSWLFKRA